MQNVFAIVNQYRSGSLDAQIAASDLDVETAHFDRLVATEHAIPRMLGVSPDTDLQLHQSIEDVDLATHHIATAVRGKDDQAVSAAGAEMARAGQKMQQAGQSLPPTLR